MKYIKLPCSTLSGEGTSCCINIIKDGKSIFTKTFNRNSDDLFYFRGTIYGDLMSICYVKLDDLKNAGIPYNEEKNFLRLGSIQIENYDSGVLENLYCESFKNEDAARKDYIFNAPLSYLNCTMSDISSGFLDEKLREKLTVQQLEKIREKIEYEASGIVEDFYEQIYELTSQEVVDECLSIAEQTENNQNISDNVEKFDKRNIKHNTSKKNKL